MCFTHGNGLFHGRRIDHIRLTNITRSCQKRDGMAQVCAPGYRNGLPMQHEIFSFDSVKLPQSIEGQKLTDCICIVIDHDAVAL